MTPTATVLIPAYNEARTVGSVVATARQAGFPVVVVDDGSGDGTGEAAARAGAQVVRLPRNRGKGAAYAAGLERIRTPYVILLDADLVGLTPDHLQALLAPVASGQADMAVGVFRGGRLLTDLGNRLTPQLSGQRALPTQLLASVPGLERARYDVELLLTRTAKERGWRVVYLPLFGLSQVMKEEKRGLWSGFWHRLRMYLEVLRYAASAKISRDR